MTTTTTASRTFLPLAESPLLTAPRPDNEYTGLAVRLAERAAPDPATITRLLAITELGAARRIAEALGARDDLPPDILALLVASRPGLQQATARLKSYLFPGAGTGACHRFARTVAALAHAPETIDTGYLATARFTESAGTADTDMLHSLLSPLLKAPALGDEADAALGALLAARRAAGAPVTAFDTAVAGARARARSAGLRAALDARREQTVSEIASHTGGLTLTAGLWFDAVRAAAGTPGQAADALAAASEAGRLLGAGEEPAMPWPAARARWEQVTATARSSTAHSRTWDQAWEAAAATPDGSAWDPSQRGLAAGYALLAAHVLNQYGRTGTPPDPDRCWATDPAGRALLHTVADHLTGHLGHSPLGHFDDTLLTAFIRALAKNRRDRIPGALQVHGLIAAVKAARSKAWLTARPTGISVGVVIPARGEARRCLPPGPGNEDGQDALAAKTAQLAWLLEARPDARAEILLVDEDPDGASASAARQAAAGHPRIRLSVASRHEENSAKGGAVLWGLDQLHGAGHAVIAYTDLDLTYPLDQLGLLLGALDQPGTGAVIGSRRLPDSHGYYPPAGPDPATLLYRQAVRELLGLHVTDPQAGFKAFTASALHDALPQVADHGLSFDTDLLAAVAAGHAVTETGVAALHRYTDGHAGTPRDYDAMLQAVHQQALRHRHAPSERATPTWDKIKAGGLAAAARSQPASVTISPAPR
jgi:hypothetical protein